MTKVAIPILLILAILCALVVFEIVPMPDWAKNSKSITPPVTLDTEDKKQEYDEMIKDTEDQLERFAEMVEKDQAEKEARRK